MKPMCSHSQIRIPPLHQGQVHCLQIPLQDPDLMAIVTLKVYYHKYNGSITNSLIVRPTLYRFQQIPQKHLYM